MVGSQYIGDCVLHGEKGAQSFALPNIWIRFSARMDNIQNTGVCAIQPRDGIQYMDTSAIAIWRERRTLQEKNSLRNEQ